ncbi:nuclear transport factor 2 family protein [Belnapia sp. T6]|uniref:Nuclear transport factor 2 family protein n=1 Tax=Belnapia mucosa TaxID=2804532 RepID=A0ABS1UZV9_9PROT|nr:nuclear transport factor 2 family protein [Belnapia mucosa]MBL6454537.1 nuclear transport factor 2 family protein [Belnapia mucosa]
MPESPQAPLDRFAANFSTLDVGAMVALFRPDAAFFGSTVPGLLRGQGGVRTYFEQAWANAARGTMTCDPAIIQHPAPDVALFATVCRLVRPDRTSAVRVSGAALRDGEEWRFAELHVSASPAPR